MKESDLWCAFAIVEGVSKQNPLVFESKNVLLLILKSYQERSNRRLNR